jgi:flagellar hook assembly protein FlgD
MIRFQVPRPTPVSLKLYDVSGRLVRVLIDSKTQNLEPNTYNLTWDGKDDRGIELPSGVYFYRLETGDFQASKKLVLIR